jgi:hypothetical protein
MAEAADALSQPYTGDAIDGWFRENYPRIKPGTVAAHIRGLTANDPSRHHYPGLAAKDPLFFRTAPGALVRFYAGHHPVAAGIPAARTVRRRRQALAGRPGSYIDPRVAASLEARPHAHRFDHTKLVKLLAELDDNYARNNAYAAHALLRDPRSHPPDARLHQLPGRGKQLPVDPHRQGVPAQAA